jgi:ribosomal protein L6P/L9E
MAKPTVYKGKEYSSRSQAALAMLADHIPMEKVALELGITSQTVFASKKRAERRMLHNILRIQRQTDEALDKAKNLQKKNEQMSKIYTKLATNFVDGRTRRHTRKFRELQSKDL